MKISPPAIAIDRKDPVRTSRSTVGTMTGLTDYVKLLYARLGKLHCRGCGEPVMAESPDHVWKALQAFPSGSEVILTFAVSANGAEHEQVRSQLGAMGFTRFFQGGEIKPVDEWRPGKGKEKIHVVVDRLLLKASEKRRIMDSLEQAFRFGEGRLDVRVRPDHHLSFSNRLECARCGISYRPPFPNLFSFNSPVGACETCRGFGRVIDVDPDLIVPNPALTLEEGAIRPWGSRKENRTEFWDLLAFCKRKNIPAKVPFHRLKSSQQKAIIDGAPGYYGVKGFFNRLETKTYRMHVRVYLSRYRSYSMCPDCGGTRFKPEVLLYRLGGIHIGQVYAMSIDKATQFFQGVEVSPRDEAGQLVLSETRSRLRYLQDVGLEYLTLDRQSRTLSGGEVERVALTSALGSSLANAIYILDEPSIGLHPRDNRRLIGILKDLRDLRNTIIVVEHDPEIIRESDFILDLGPGAGEDGGQITYFGPTARINNSLTGEYLKGKKVIPLPEKRRRPKRGRWLIIRGAAEHNLKAIDVGIPLGLFVCLTGVSGSGKSTLVEEILYKGIKKAKGDPKGRPGFHRAIDRLELIDDVVLVDQRPIGRNPRANPLTYTKAMDPIRRLFADTETARSLNFGPGHFSFNVTGGRCETCKGEGFEKVEMQFLSDVFITCPDCQGMRYGKDVLEVAYRGKNINDILQMTVEKALRFFEDNPQVVSALVPVGHVGLGYIRLGQPVNTLSGGEAQRLKLSRYLRASKVASTLYIFDEPTTGLHFDDIKKFLVTLQQLVSKGNTVLVIEHNMDVVKSADWVIDLGPEGGDGGGRVVGVGSPEKLAGLSRSHTGKFLKEYLNGRIHLKPEKRRPKKREKPQWATTDVIDVRGATAS